MSHKLSDVAKKNLKSIVDHFDLEDVGVRERQIRQWRRLKLLWDGFQNVWYSEVAHDWRVYDLTDDGNGTDQAAYDKKVNVFKAYLESIIAALSVTVPPIKCFPDDADNTLDLSTAKAGDKISELLFRHNDLTLFWLHSLYIYCTEGMVACYTYTKEDKEYGTYTKKEFKEEIQERTTITCEHCGYEVSSANPIITAGENEPVNETVVPPVVDPNINPEAAPIIDPALQQQQVPVAEEDEVLELDNNEDEFMPGELEGMEQCPACNQLALPRVSKEKFTVTRLVGETKEPKARVKMESFGGLYVKVPVYARKQEDCPYLKYSYETNVVNALERFKHLKKEDFVEKIAAQASPGGYDTYGSWGRLNTQYQGEYPLNNVTMHHAWLRPCSFYVIADENEREELLRLFPNGCRVDLVNDLFGDACKSALDDHWTLTYNPLSDYVHFDPLGSLLVSIQEMTVDLVSLTLQTIEHGVGLTFADPAVLDFKAFKEQEVVPGAVFPATPKSGKTLSDAFKELKTAQLSGEVLPFSQQIQQLGQLVSGAVPSLFGGQIEGSETASEYSMSKANAMQRLQNPWKMLSIWFKNCMGKAIPMYIKEIKEDEHDVKQNKDGSFINVFIRKAELEGKIGKIELEGNENLPLNWHQRKDIVMALLQSPNQQIMSFLAAPENLYIFREAIGLDNFFIPGEDDREKQWEEIKLLVNSEPLELPPDPELAAQAEAMGQDPEIQEFPSVEVEPEVDNHVIQFEICKGWLVSEAGRLAKTENPAGYKNVLLHALQHLGYIQAQVPQGEAMGGEGAENPEKPKNDVGAPIKEESDVQAAT